MMRTVRFCFWMSLFTSCGSSTESELDQCLANTTVQAHDIARAEAQLSSAYELNMHLEALIKAQQQALSYSLDLSAAQTEMLALEQIPFVVNYPDQRIQLERIAAQNDAGLNTALRDLERLCPTYPECLYTPPTRTERSDHVVSP